jgi:sugar transferase (PEP-CTERM/EpsH1 system associated)
LGAALTEQPGTIAGPLRVMHVMYELRFGGMELGVTKLVNAHDRSRVASSICSCRPATAAKTRLAEDIPLFEFHRRVGNDPLLVARLAALMRRERPHIVHTHAWGTLCEGLVAARLARVPVVVHGEHGTLNTKRRNLMVQNWAWRRVDQVLSVSSTLATRMAAEVGFPAAGIRTIRNGVDLSRFQQRSQSEARQLLGLDPTALVVGTVGRLVPVKNQALLLDAVAALQRRNVRLTAVIVGDGPLKQELASRAEALGIAPSVRLLGERPDVERVLAAFDVFVLTSVSEGLSNTIQEAMASGLPVVATRVGGADELVDQDRTGVLVPSNDPIALADALESLLVAPERRLTMARAARTRAQSEFSLDKMVGAYEELYYGLMQRRAVAAVAAGRS